MFKHLSIIFPALLMAGCTVSKLPLEATTVADPSAYMKNAKGQLFSNFHGVQMNPTRIELEGEGMTIFIEEVDLPPTKKSLNKIKNAYMADGDIYKLEETALPAPNLVLLGGEAITNEFATTALLFEVPTKDSTMYVIGVESAFMLDFERAGLLVKDIVENGPPSYVITEKNARVADFAGRPIELGNVCEWKAPHHLACNNLGELQWSLFTSIEDANLSRQINMAITEARSEKLLEKNEKVKITFEGKPVTAVKARYRTDRPASEGSNELIVYYVVTSLRGYQVFCKASFYSDQADESGLSPLAAKVISL